MEAKNSYSRLIGSVLIIVGTCIGAGMLVLPLVTAAMGFWVASLSLIAIALLMGASAFLILEVNLHFKAGANFGSMARHTLGRWGEVATWLSFALLMYALSAAYTSSASSLLSIWLNKLLGWSLPNSLNALIFILVMGAFVYSGTRAVDGFNKFLISIKGISFFGLVFVLSPHISFSQLVNMESGIPYIWVALPILVTSFGYHNVIPSLRTYLNSDRRALKWVIIIGTLVPLAIYLTWEVITLGTIPLTGAHSFQYIASHGEDIKSMLEVYQAKYDSTWITLFETLFTNIAVTTSFLGVTLSLFAFNQDTYRLRKQKATHKVPVFVLTFLPAFVFATFYPNGFIAALGYAGLMVAVWLILLPPMMAWKVRRLEQRNSVMSQCYLLFIFLCGLGLIALQVLSGLGVLPKFH